MEPAEDAGRGREPGREWDERLDELYARAEAEAVRAAAWYSAGRVRKRRAARLLRLGTVLAAACGAALPLLSLDRWGCVALVGALACAGSDRYLGLTSGWMRDVATAQALRRRLETLRYDWAAERLRLAPAGEAELRALAVLRRFSEDVNALVRAETACWMREFGSGQVLGEPLARVLATAAAPAGPAEAARRANAEPPARPTMPRQRPPEGRAGPS